jgi:hypothetical protein
MAIANNPFDLGATKSGNTTGTLLSSAVSGTAAPDVTGYNAGTAGATGYTSAGANAFGYNPSSMTSQGYNAAQRNSSGYDASSMTGQGYDAAQAGGTNWNVDNNQTVQGQVAGILAANSPLLRQAQATSLAQMNQRGLANSSIAIGGVGTLLGIEPI